MRCCYTPRSSWIRCLVILAFVLLFNTPTLVSLPYLPTFDIANVNFNTTVKLHQGLENTDIQELRLGIWSACFYDSSNALTCLKAGCGYTIHMSKTVRNQTITATIPSSYTTGLIIHPVATAVVFIVFLSALNTSRKLLLAVGYLALLLSWAAFWVDVSLLVRLGSQAGSPAFGGNVAGGIGMWMTMSTAMLFMFSEYRNGSPNPGCTDDIVGFQLVYVMATSYWENILFWGDHPQKANEQASHEQFLIIISAAAYKCQPGRAYLGQNELAFSIKSGPLQHLSLIGMGETLALPCYKSVSERKSPLRGALPVIQVYLQKNESDKGAPSMNRSTKPPSKPETDPLYTWPHISAPSGNDNEPNGKQKFPPAIHPQSTRLAQPGGG